MCICRINFIIPYLNTSFLSLHTLISLLESKLVLMDGNNRKIDIPSGLFCKWSRVIPWTRKMWKLIFYGSLESIRCTFTWHQQNANEMTRVRVHSPTLGSSWISTVWTFYFFWPKTKQQGRWINEKSCHNMWTHDWQWSEFCQWARLGDVDGLLLTTETTPLHSLFCSFHHRWQQAPLMIDDWESGKCPRLFADDCFLLSFCYCLSLGLLLSGEECQQQEGN